MLTISVLSCVFDYVIRSMKYRLSGCLLIATQILVLAGCLHGGKDVQEYEHESPKPSTDLRVDGRFINLKEAVGIELSIANVANVDVFVPLHPLIVRYFANNSAKLDPLSRHFYGAGLVVLPQVTESFSSMGEFYPPLIDYTVVYTMLEPKKTLTVNYMMSEILHESLRAVPNAVVVITLKYLSIGGNAKSGFIERLKEGVCNCRDTVVRLEEVNSKGFIEIDNSHNVISHVSGEKIDHCIESALCDSLSAISGVTIKTISIQLNWLGSASWSNP